VLWSLVYFVVRRLFGGLIRRRTDEERDLEILVLRHELKVLRRHVRQPQLRRTDRLLLTAASRILPRVTWSSFLVTVGSRIQIRSCRPRVILVNDSA